MKPYQALNPFYCEIDLRTNDMYACVIDQNGKKLLEQLKPYSSDVVVRCESTCN